MCVRWICSLSGADPAQVYRRLGKDVRALICLLSGVDPAQVYRLLGKVARSRVRGDLDRYADPIQRLEVCCRDGGVGDHEV